MKRTSLHSLEPSSARKKIAAAKANKPFMMALLHRDHRGHKEAVDQWSRLHEAAFPEPNSSAGIEQKKSGGGALSRNGTISIRKDASAGEPNVVAPSQRSLLPAKSRLQDNIGTADSPSSGAVSNGKGELEPPVVNIEADRIQVLIDDAPALFQIGENPDADKTYADHRANHNAGVYAVWQHSAIIEREAERQGVDADLVKAIMYVENAHGKNYGDVTEALGVADTILPMNISMETWSGLGAEPEEFFDPEINIRIGVMLVRRIRDRIAEPTPEKIASIWIFTGRELVNDYGARVQDVYERRVWMQPIVPESDLNYGTP